MNKMNILMVHPHDIYSSVEPWTVRIVYIAREFVNKGHRVKLVYFPLEWKDQKSSKPQDNLTIIPLSRELGIHKLTVNIFKLCGMAKWADVVHFQKCFYHAAIPAMIAALLRNKPVHYDWDDWELKIYEVSTKPGVLRSFIWNFLKILETTIPRIVDTVSVASHRLRIECESLGVSRDRIFEAHVGADIAKFRPDIRSEPIRQKYAIERPLVLYLGQLHGGQYVELFIEAASQVINNCNEDVSFMIVGDGYMRDELEKFSHRLNLDGKIIFTGAVPHDLVPQYIAAADICVACFGEDEVTMCKSPLKIVEYLASGKAIVASRVGEVPDMIQDAGVLVPPGDAKALAEGIVKVLRDSSLRKNLQILARRRAEEKYNWTVTADNLSAAYKKAIKIKGNDYYEKEG